MDDDLDARGSFARASVSKSTDEGEAAVAADALFRNRHFRISVDVRSLSNLRRAANLVRFLPLIFGEHFLQYISYNIAHAYI